MKRILCFLFVILLTLGFAGCAEKKEDDGVLSIVVTAFPHYDFARQITKGAENVEIKMLIPPGSEVHSYEPTPSDMLAVAGSDVFIFTGGESEVWAKKLISSAQNENMSVISFMDLCEGLISEREKEHEEHNSHEGHEHTYDEHVWTSPSMAAHLAGEIGRVLSGLDGDNAEFYLENALELEKSIEKVKAVFAEAVEVGVRREITVADRFPFYHLAEEFGIDYSAAYPGCSHSTEPSAAVIASLSEKVKNENIPYVFTIEFSNGKIARSVTEGTDAEILTLHSCHNVSKEDFEKGVTYCELMMENAANLRKALCE